MSKGVLFKNKKKDKEEGNVMENTKILIFSIFNIINTILGLIGSNRFPKI